jgi:hypothetical protein
VTTPSRLAPSRLASRAALPFLLVALALGASACSDDEPDATPTSDAPSSSAEPIPSVSSATAPIQTITPEPVDPSGSAEPTEATPSVDPDGLPTTYEQGVARLDEAKPDYVQLERFHTPDDTYCSLRSEDFVGCELGAGAGIPDPDYCGSDGASQKVGRVMITDDGVTAECNSDTIREGGAELVPVGGAGSSAKNGIRCLVEEVGVTCVDDLRSGGFFLGAERYIVFTG